MIVVNAKYHKITTVSTTTANGYKCSAMAGMVIVNNDAYCIKSAVQNGNKLPVVFYRISNIDTSNIIQRKWVIKTGNGTENIAVHANSITYANHVFYITTMNPSGRQVLGFKVNYTGNEADKNGVILDDCSYKYLDENGNGKPIYSINYFDTQNGDIRFLASVEKNSTGYTYQLLRASGNKLVNENIKFKVKNWEEKIYNTGNDSYYDRATKMLYTTRFCKEGSKVVRNAILQYDLSAGISGTTKEYSPVRVIEISAINNEAKFEIEGMSIFNGKKYICTKTNNVSGKEGEDAIYSISKIS